MNVKIKKRLCREYDISLKMIRRAFLGAFLEAFLEGLLGILEFIKLDSPSHKTTC